MEHEHYFQSIKGVTTMTDQFYYKVPFGLIGRIFDFFILKKYMIKILTMRLSENRLKSLLAVRVNHYFNVCAIPTL